MDIVKKNLVSILCVVVAVVAIVSLFFPTAGMYESLAAEVKTSADIYPTLNDLRTKSSRTIPATDPSLAEPEPLGRFPTQTVITQGQGIVDERARVAASILNLALLRNEKKPLVPGSLPNPAQRAAFDFRQQYRQAANADGNAADRSIPRAVLRGTTPPTGEEIQQAADRTATQINQSELRFVNNQATNAADVSAKIEAELKDLPERLRQQRASQNLIYVEPAAFVAHPAITGGQAPDAVSIFNAQALLWSQQEAAGAIANANKGATSVLDAPVKHLLALDIPLSFAGLGAGAGGAAPALAEGEVAPEMAVDPAAAITPNYKVSPTGRPDHSPLYDLVRFPMVLRVEAAKVPQVLNALSADRLLTVTNVDFVAFDSANALAAGYVYGDKPVVELRIECELLYLRRWLVPLMPAPVKAAIAADEAAIAAAATAAEG